MCNLLFIIAVLISQDPILNKMSIPILHVLPAVTGGREQNGSAVFHQLKKENLAGVVGFKSSVDGTYSRTLADKEPVFQSSMIASDVYCLSRNCLAIDSATYFEVDRKFEYSKILREPACQVKESDRNVAILLTVEGMTTACDAGDSGDSGERTEVRNKDRDHSYAFQPNVISNTPLYRCSICGWFYEHMSIVKKHLKSAHKCADEAVVELKSSKFGTKQMARPVFVVTFRDTKQNVRDNIDETNNGHIKPSSKTFKLISKSIATSDSRGDHIVEISTQCSDGRSAENTVLYFVCHLCLNVFDNSEALVRHVSSQHSPRSRRVKKQKDNSGDARTPEQSCTNCGQVNFIFEGISPAVCRNCLKGRYISLPGSKKLQRSNNQSADVSEISGEVLVRPSRKAVKKSRKVVKTSRKRSYNEKRSYNDRDLTRGVCDVKCETLDILVDHFESQHQTRVVDAGLSQSKSSKKCKSSNGLERSENRPGNYTYTCKICSRVFTDFTSMHNHLKRDYVGMRNGGLPPLENTDSSSSSIGGNCHKSLKSDAKDCSHSPVDHVQTQTSPSNEPVPFDEADSSQGQNVNALDNVPVCTSVRRTSVDVASNSGSDCAVTHSALDTITISNEDNKEWFDSIASRESTKSRESLKFGECVEDMKSELELFVKLEPIDEIVPVDGAQDSELNFKIKEEIDDWTVP